MTPSANNITCHARGGGHLATSLGSLDQLIESFFNLVSKLEIELYNEFSLQHELGIFLRKNLSNLKIQFERNVSFFTDKTDHFIKREIDIVAYDENRETLDFAIELKYPRNGQHPEQMFGFCKDIAFMEQVKEIGFKKTYFIALAEDPLFYSGSNEGIYAFFRSERPIQGIIQKPTGKKDFSVTVRGPYVAKWRTIVGSLKHTLIETHTAGCPPSRA